MHYLDIRLPENVDELIGCYMYLTAKLRALWIEYVNFVESPYTTNPSSLYKIVFSEMDFFEGLRIEVSAMLPERTLNNLRNLDDYSGW